MNSKKAELLALANKLLCGYPTSIRVAAADALREYAGMMEHRPIPNSEYFIQQALNELHAFQELTKRDTASEYAKMLDQEPVVWTGCGECDPEFPCWMGQAKCLRLNNEQNRSISE